jgi:spermidine synthase
MDKNTENPRKFLELFLISFVSLFLELSMIRWVPGVVPSVSYFTNIVLISSFLGLGLGCAISRKKVDFILMPALFVFFVSFAILLKQLRVAYWGNLTDYIFVYQTRHGVPMFFAIPAIFLLNFFVFMYIGAILGKCLEYFKPLTAYSINIFASIIGIVIFTSLSFLFMPPFVWFFIAFVILAWFLRERFLYAVICFTSCLILIASYSGGEVWSPYYKIDIFKSSSAQFFHLTVNNNWYQHALDFSPQKVKSDPFLKHWRDIYNVPYLFAKPRKVLILGSGVGNDISLALENNIPRIDCVEIDPGIINIARSLRPDDPYGREGVRLFIDDARSYMNSCVEKYDLIVYGFLDSHALFANMPSVRLDNFVYTIEGIKKAKGLLSEDGAIALSFFVGRDWLGNKIYYMLKDIFGKSPLVYVSKELDTEMIFIASLSDKGMAKREIPGFLEISHKYESSKKLPLPTDDWPYFYLKDKNIPLQYLLILLIVMIISGVSIYSCLPDRKMIFNYFSFFFLGASFMLIETKSIVQLSMLFGNTWIVNAAVILGILLMIFAANIYTVIFKPRKVWFFYIFLAISLFTNWGLNPDNLALNSKVLMTLISVLLSAIPLFFAAIIFAFLLNNAESVPLAFGVNLLGAVFGGFLEYSSLALGLNNLALVAIILYFFSYLGYKKIISQVT